MVAAGRTGGRGTVLRMAWQRAVQNLEPANNRPGLSLPSPVEKPVDAVGGQRQDHERSDQKDEYQRTQGSEDSPAPAAPSEPSPTEPPPLEQHETFRQRTNEQRKSVNGPVEVSSQDRLNVSYRDSRAPFV